MDELEIFDCEQGTPEWLAARAGIITASVFNVVQMKGRGGGVSETRRKLLYQLAAEQITGMPCPQWGGNEHTERGKVMEAEVRALYEASSEAPVKQVGFLRRGRLGASPDSLVGDDGLLEIKTKLPHLQIDVLLAGVLPQEHVAQVQGQLLVSGRRWCDFVSYWPGLPEFRIRVYPDLAYQSQLAADIRTFNSELDALVARIGGMA